MTVARAEPLDLVSLTTRCSKRPITGKYLFIFTRRGGIVAAMKLPALRSAPVMMVVFALASAMAVGLGAWAMATSGLPVSLWLRNPLAWVAGLGLGLIVWRFPLRPPVVLVVALCLVGATYLFPGQDHVHRWIALGPIQINAAALCLPMVVATFNRGRYSLLAYIVLATLINAQPDASQLAAFFIPYFIFLFSRDWKGTVTGLFLGIVVSATALIGIDRLPPVAHVEGIVGMAASHNLPLAIGILAALSVTALSPLLLPASATHWTLARGLALYFAVTIGFIATGYFPVPLAGYGISYVIGWWLGIGQLAGARHSEFSVARST